MLKSVLLYAATVATALSVVPADNAVAQLAAEFPAIHEPELLFDITDEAMADPLGIVIDVAVGTNGVIYLLDQQNYNIRRITFSGELKSPLGRRGEGPGELSRPSRLVCYPDGRCLVIQGMSNRTVCLTHTGDACDMGDISLFRSGYANTIIVRAELDKSQQLILSTITTQYRASNPNTSLEDRGTIASVRRSIAGNDKIEGLFTTEAEALEKNTVLIPLSSHGYIGYIRQGWDINKSGVIIYSDPNGGYSVQIGHPVDGASRSISLLEWQHDEKKIKKLVEDADGKLDVNEVSRISSVEWLDTEFFMVQPTAELSLTPIADIVRTVEVFRKDGSSFGRYDIHCSFDPSVDEMFIRGDIVVLIIGGKSVARAVFSGELPGEKDQVSAKSAEVEEIRVVAYRLFGPLRATNSN